jgi:predicted nucleotidyltransferase
MEAVTIPADLPVTIDRGRLVEICRHYGIRELSLFGSVLRDDFTPDSDVDVLYELAPTSPVQTLFDLGGLAMDLEDLLGRAVDLTNKQQVYPALANDILATRRVIYVAENRYSNDPQPH